MSEDKIEKSIMQLVFLTRGIRVATVSILGCFLTVICIVLVVDVSERVYGREQLQDTTKFDLIGVLLASSAFLTTVGAGLSAWFVIDATARYKQLIDTVGEYKQLSVDDEEGNLKQ
jgi:pheromone shutdown protein TraB